MHMMRSSTARVLASLACAAMLHGCALRAGTYQPLLDNVETLKKSSVRSAALGEFVVQAGAEGGTSIGLRGNSMTSPIGSDYAAYLAAALRQELQLAGKLDPKSDLVISGTLLKNDVAAGGFGTNSGEIEARFVVRAAGSVRYDATKRVQPTWDSSPAAAVAIPQAQLQYPLMVQQLIAQLLADAQFVAALH